MESMTNAPYLLPGARARLPPRRPDGRRLDDVRRPLLRLRPGGHGRRHREVRRLGRHRPRARRTSSPPSRTSVPPTAIKDGLFDDEIVAGGRAPAQGRPDRGRHRRGRPRRHHHRVARQRCARRSTRPATSPPATPRQISDGGSAVIVTSQGQGRGARHRPRSARSSATARSPVPTPSLLHAAVARHQGRARQGRQVGHRRRPVRAERGVRRRRRRLDGRARHHRRDRQRERRRHRPRSPGRHVRQPRGAHPRSTSCSAAAAASVPPPCAAAAARATPSCCARCSHPARRLRQAHPSTTRSPHPGAGSARRPARRSGHGGGHATSPGPDAAAATIRSPTGRIEGDPACLPPPPGSRVGPT